MVCPLVSDVGLRAARVKWDFGVAVDANCDTFLAAAGKLIHFIKLKVFFFLFTLNYFISCV